MFTKILEVEFVGRKAGSPWLTYGLPLDLVIFGKNRGVWLIRWVSILFVLYVNILL